jgi:uncharacterized protein
MSRAASFLRLLVRSAGLAPAIFLFLFACLAATPALAQGTTPVQRSYINPFPGGDRYRIVVLGDSLGEALWSGLYRAFEDDPNLEFVNRSKASTGFSRIDYYNWDAELSKILKDGTYQIAVVMFGANDNQGIRKGKDWLKPGSEGWREIYGERVETFIKKLRAENIATYWVGLPVMRSPNQTSDAEIMNEVFREKAFINGAKYVDTWTGFTDEAGRYTAYGPDMSGQVKRLRADDGVHFTMRGYLKLAHFVEKDLRKDLSLAKLERNIPLAGNEEEQAKVMGRLAAVATAPPAAAAPDESVAGEGTAQADATEPSGGEADAATDESAPQSSRIGEVSVIRPVLPDTALQAAQNITPQSPAPINPDAEMIMSELPVGLTAVATISAVTDLSLASSKPRLPLTQRPYYKVLIKGEQLEPKSGRADDFAWPPN